MGHEYDVVIAGAGPVGLTLALSLGKQGARVYLADKRPALGKLPKMERCNARTMENFRRLGIAQRIRDAGLDNDMPMDVFICLQNLQNPPLVRHVYPSVNELKAQYRSITDGSAPAEPYQLISQYTLEPLLVEIARELPNVTIEFDREVIAFEQEDTGVRTTLRSADPLAPQMDLSSSYLAGCDGASSTVRRLLGIHLEGESRLQMRQALFYSEELIQHIPIGLGRHYHVADDTNTFLIVQDDKKHFSLHATVDSDEEMAPLFERVIGPGIPYTTLYIGQWQQHLMQVDRYRDGRVFLAGDSAHLVIPTGGLGMNTGHGDAVDLAWKLAATIHGWAGPKILDSYQAERLPIATRNIAASRKAATARAAWRSMWRPQITSDSDEGERVRRALTEVADREQRWSNDLYGIELGYYYGNSPVIAYDGNTPGPQTDLNFHYAPSVALGARLPNTWLPDGRPIQDVLGFGFTILDARGGIHDDLAGLEQAIIRTGAPVERVAVDSPAARDVYQHRVLVLRPDLHIVWSGTHAPQDPDRIARIITGRDE